MPSGFYHEYINSIKVYVFAERMTQMVSEIKATRDVCLSHIASLALIVTDNRDFINGHCVYQFAIDRHLYVSMWSDVYTFALYIVHKEYACNLLLKERNAI